MWTPTATTGTSATAPGEKVGDNSLVTGTRLDEFEIVRVLGAGGFGIVYLALDHVLLRYVAIKEYMPAGLAGRRTGSTLAVRSAHLGEPFARGLDSFFEEARLLAGFDHPSLVKVHRFWKANGTAYMAMQYYPGLTLKEARHGMQASPDGAWLRAFVEALLGALDALHREGVYHRDISPDNILLLPDGRPVLLDFGSARRVLGDRTQALTAILKPNFAPVEQYADEPAMRQGPWTDLYALGATVHFLLTNENPAPAVMRAISDELPSLSKAGGAGFPNVPREFLAAIDWTLALAPRDRPQSVASARQALEGLVLPPAASSPKVPTPEPEPKPSEIGSGVADDVATDCAMGQHIPPPLIDSSGPARRMLGILALCGLAALGWGCWALSLSSPALFNAIITTAADASPSVSTATRVSTSSLGAIVASSTGPMSLPPTTGEHVSSTATGLATGPPDAPRPADEANATPLKRTRDAEMVPATTEAVVEAAARASPRLTPGRRRPTEETAEIGGLPPTSPTEVCGDRSFFSRAICINRECRAPHSSALPECVQARRAEESRQRRMEQQ